MNNHATVFVRTVALTVVLCFSAACATSSKNISASYVSPLQYTTYSCDQLRLEYLRISNRVVEISGRQDSAATRDAIGMGVGLVLFFPALLLLAGSKGNPDELARLKGECDAIEVSAIEKNCQLAQQIKDEKLMREHLAKQEIESEKKVNAVPGEVLK